MKTIRKVAVKSEHVRFIPEKLEQDVVYISDEFKTSVHLCLCGCGNKSVTPIGDDFINGWDITENEKGVTFKPSILNKNCPNRYHYIITNGVANVI